ncbi:MAG: TlyA family RNA methyltransferase, partial [Clostridia bacterium]|nr:TlyA family RNA methyltransferase [Clostridia bacterium]
MRLDVFLQKNGYYPSRNKAAEACQRGEVTVNGVVKNKPSYEVDGTETIVTSGVRYVSLGAYKMLRALDVFGYDCKDKVFADIGASTGGFTQCLLMGGAKKVYCVDVGKDLLDASIACDERVVVMDETNARYLKKQDFADAIDAITVDCSFISVKTLLPALKEVVGESGDIIALIKPQFECGKKY